MYANLSLQQNHNRTYDLIIRYDRNGSEFGMDFFSKNSRDDSHRTIAAFLQEKARGLRVRRAKIIAGTLVLAVLPIHMLLPTSAADRFGSAYLYVGTEKQQIQYVRGAQGALDVVSPSYFDIRSDGSLQFNAPSTGAVDDFHNLDVRVVPFISNHWDRQGGIAALESREELALEIAELVEQHEFDGVNVDLENLTPAEREDFVEFVSLLREHIPAEKEVSVAVAANPWGWNWGWQGSYDYQGLGQFSDYLMLMAYDEHYQGGEEGPVASTGFVEDSILYALEHLPPEQIVVGLPLFGRIWSDDGYFEGHGVPLSLVEELIETYDALVFFDEDAGAPRATFEVFQNDPKLSINGRTLRPGTYTLWYEDNRSIAAKLDLVDAYDLKGTSFWALGQQSEGVWETYQSWRDGAEFYPEPELPEEPGEGELPVFPDDGDGDGGEENNGGNLGPGGSGNGSGGTLTGRPSGSRPSGGGGSGGGGGARGGGGGGGSSGTANLVPMGFDAAATLANTPAATLQQTASINASGAVLRQTPDALGQQLSVIQPGSIVAVLESVQGWHKVQLAAGTTGYVASEDLQMHKIGVVTPVAGVQVYAQVTQTDVSIASLPSGTAVTILETYPNGWCKVRLADKRVGYATSRYLARSPLNQTITIRTTSSALRLRETPASDAVIYGTVPAGEQILVLDATTHPGYTRIAYGATTAYVSNGYFK